MNPFQKPLLYFMMEVLLAEAIFLYPAEKRRFFPLRYIAAWAICLLCAFFYPSASYTPGGLSIVEQLIQFLIMFAISVASMGLCFRLPFTALLSSCVAGYAVEHIAFHIVKIARHCGFLQETRFFGLSNRISAEMLLFPLVYLIFLSTIGYYAAQQQCYKKADMRFNLTSLVIIYLCIGLTRAAQYFGDGDSITVSLYAISSCLMALTVQMVLSKAVELKAEKDSISLLWQEDRKQYEISKKTIDTINIKYHDLKHKLKNTNLPQEEINAIQDAVRVYGSRVRTGSEALDVLLTENTLRLNEEGITLTYTGNGENLDFMNTMDIYSLFGNAVENAVEAVRQISEPEKRVIDIVTERMGDMLNVTVSNYFSGSIQTENGLPVTSKKEEEGFHGFGIKSMSLIAQKYHGSLEFFTRGDLFVLTIYLMRP